MAQLKPKIHLLIPCAGIGSRMQSSTPKQYQLINGKAIIDHSIAALQQITAITNILVVIAQNAQYNPKIELNSKIQIKSIGGVSRAQTVKNGLNYLAKTASTNDWVLVHDAARCLVKTIDVIKLIDTCLAQQTGGLLAIPIADTIKQTDHATIPQVQTTIERNNKWLAQTPQMFPLHKLLAALEQPDTILNSLTDEANAMELQGYKPIIVPGRTSNFKITNQQDLALAKLILANSQ